MSSSDTRPFPLALSEASCACGPGDNCAPSEIGAPAGGRRRSLTERLLPAAYGRSVLTLLGLIVVGVVAIVVFGEAFGLFDLLTRYVPWPIGAALVVAGGYPVFAGTVRAALRRQVTSSTLMSIGALAAVASGRWPVALVVVAFMRVSDYVEGFTVQHGRQAVRDLLALAPQTARVLRDGLEQEVRLDEVKVGDLVVVRPGETIAVDGEVIGGRATVDQANLTGESIPIEVAEGDRVFAATIAQLGSLRVRASRVGSDTTFGRVVQLVEQAEAHRAEVQRLADKFATYYLPVVAVLAALTFLIRRDPSATVAVLVVACSCSFALATPIAILASVGAGAKRGLLIKGGKYLEALARADVVLIDKTGTLTLGRPSITEVVSLNGLSDRELLTIAASAERYSEHPLAEAVRVAAANQGLALPEPEHFEALPGLGIRARVNGQTITIGNRRATAAAADTVPVVRELEGQGKSLLFVARNDELLGVLAAADTLRPEVPTALAELRTLGIKHIELLTGDNERVASSIGQQLGVTYRANLLPEDKIRIVQELQAQGRDRRRRQRRPRPGPSPRRHRHGGRGQRYRHRGGPRCAHAGRLEFGA